MPAAWALSQSSIIKHRVTPDLCFGTGSRHKAILNCPILHDTALLSACLVLVKPLDLVLKPKLDVQAVS